MYHLQDLFKIMSRSFKKNPIIRIVLNVKGESMRFAKKKANKKCRKMIKENEDIPSGSFYRRMDNRWDWPDDGKQWYDEPSSYRK